MLIDVEILQTVIETPRVWIMQALRMSDIGPSVVKCFPRLPNWCWHSCAGAPSNWVLAMLKLCIRWMIPQLHLPASSSFEDHMTWWYELFLEMICIQSTVSRTRSGPTTESREYSIVASGQGCKHGLFFLDRAHAARAHRLSKRNFICLMRTSGGHQHVAFWGPFSLVQKPLISAFQNFTKLAYFTV